MSEINGFHTGLLEGIAKQVGWEKLIRAVQALAEQDRDRNERMKGTKHETVSSEPVSE